VSAALVLLVPDAGDPGEGSRADQSDSDGSFFLGGLAPGSYRLFVLEDVWDIDWRKPEALEPYRKKALPLVFAPGEARSLDVEVQNRPD